MTTPKQKHNYPNGARRVRPTTPKPSKRQREMLETLARGNAVVVLHLSRGKYHAYIEASSKTANLGTVNALINRGWVMPNGITIVSTRYIITDTGRAALQAVQS